MPIVAVCTSEFAGGPVYIGGLLGPSPPWKKVSLGDDSMVAWMHPLAAEYTLAEDETVMPAGIRAPITYSGRSMPESPPKAVVPSK